VSPVVSWCSRTPAGLLLRRYQISAKHDAQVAKVEEVAEIVENADDAVFEALCHRIGVENIRDYENVQLRAAEQENAVLLKYRSQIARLNHQCVFVCLG
jgi:structural maintenance of chromosome 1